MPKENNIQLSIIIVNYKVAPFLKQCVLSVLDASKDISSEIIVVDNNSDDGSCEMIKSTFKNVILIANKKNTGFSTANNQGVAIAKGKYVLILNPDTVVSENTFTEILNFAEKQAKFGALGTKLIDGTGTFLPESKRGVPTPKVSLSKILGFPKKGLETYYATHIKENETGKVSVLVGAFMLIKKNVYNEVNGFDEDYFMYGEDIDLSYKILKKGYDNFYFPKVQTIHYKGESTTKDKKYLKRFYGAMHIFYDKHFTINPFLDIATKIGIQILLFFKTFQLQKKNLPIQKPNTFIYIGKNGSTFAKLKTKLNLELAVFHKEIMPSEIKNYKNCLLIFDNNSITNEVIITTIQKLKNNELLFRFIPKNCNYLIGSDSNNSKGTVLEF